MDSPCDKCQRPVPRANNVVILEMKAYPESAMELITTPSRHLLPVIEDGKVICEGSPSRAQYLPGQPVDPRPEHAIDPDAQIRYRTAYAELQRESEPIGPKNDNPPSP